MTPAHSLGGFCPSAREGQQQNAPIIEPKNIHPECTLMFPISSMVPVYLPTWKPYKSTIHVGKYTGRPMDGMGFNSPVIDITHHGKQHKKQNPLPAAKKRVQLRCPFLWFFFRSKSGRSAEALLKKRHVQ